MELKPQRLLSLDFFRGLTVATMILVNNPGSWGHIYAPLEHAEWNGCTPTDLVFPFFLFIVGVSIAYAMGSKKLDPSSHNKTILKALKRGLILFGLGIFLSIFPRKFSDFDFIEAIKHVRIPGVLQRIGVVFFISSVLFLKLSEKNIFRAIIIILITYWALMMFVPVPEVGYANLEKETNLGAWLDRTILTEAHLWKSAKTWDPEGILSTLPAIATGLFGVLVGVYLKRKDVEPAKKIAWLFSVGTVSVLAGLLWDLEFPINKALWTSSYVLYTGGLATIVLSLSYWIIDINNYNRFTKPFVVYGVNAITVFFVSGLMPRLLNMIKIKQSNGDETGALSWFYQTFFPPYFSPINASLAYAITFVLFFYVILWIMYKKNIIIKV
ncbi:acyltransferase family protein [Pedobacter frigiditerrae]|uniref:acyltransferase family protein n=1 Tax=Pedobacter frigiditerrae TaxID=2530452 RepID=UPI00292FC110|nr:heparan-alpha-glucosaminide N-acetyltransferase domain-containing protein [Pedobacter frigiditerrae]